MEAHLEPPTMGLGAHLATVFSVPTASLAPSPGAKTPQTRCHPSSRAQQGWHCHGSGNGSFSYPREVASLDRRELPGKESLQIYSPYGTDHTTCTHGRCDPNPLRPGEPCAARWLLPPQWVARRQGLNLVVSLLRIRWGHRFCPSSVGN